MAKITFYNPRLLGLIIWTLMFGFISRSVAWWLDRWVFITFHDFDFWFLIYDGWTDFWFLIYNGWTDGIFLPLMICDGWTLDKWNFYTFLNFWTSTKEKVFMMANESSVLTSDIWTLAINLQLLYGLFLAFSVIVTIVIILIVHHVWLQCGLFTAWQFAPLFLYCQSSKRGCRRKCRSGLICSSFRCCKSWVKNSWKSILAFFASFHPGSGAHRTIVAGSNNSPVPHNHSPASGEYACFKQYI